MQRGAHRTDAHQPSQTVSDDGHSSETRHLWLPAACARRYAPGQIGQSIGGEVGRTTGDQCESRQRQGDMGHDTEVRALRQRFPVIRCIGRILHATDVTHPNLAFLPGHTRRRGVFLGWRPHTTHISCTRHVSNAVMSWREATSTGVNFRRPYGMESSIPIAQANVNCRLPPIRAISPLRRIFAPRRPYPMR